MTKEQHEQIRQAIEELTALSRRITLLQREEEDKPRAAEPKKRIFGKRRHVEVTAAEYLSWSLSDIGMVTLNLENAIEADGARA